MNFQKKFVLSPRLTLSFQPRACSLPEGTPPHPLSSPRRRGHRVCPGDHTRTALPTGTLAGLEANTWEARTSGQLAAEGTASPRPLFFLQECEDHGSLGLSQASQGITAKQQRCSAGDSTRLGTAPVRLLRAWVPEGSTRDLPARPGPGLRFWARALAAPCTATGGLAGCRDAHLVGRSPAPSHKRLAGPRSAPMSPHAEGCGVNTRSCSGGGGTPRTREDAGRLHRLVGGPERTSDAGRPWCHRRGTEAREAAPQDAKARGRTRSQACRLPAL